MAMQWQGLTEITEEGSYAGFATGGRVIAVDRGSAAPDRIGEEDSRATQTRVAAYRSTLLGIDEPYSFDLKVTGVNIGEILKWALGAANSSGDLGGGTYRHTFTLANVLESFTLAFDRGVTPQPRCQIAGCKVNTLTFENAARDILGATVEGVGKIHRFNGAMTVSEANKANFAMKPFIFANLEVRKGLDGAAQAVDTQLERVSVAINNTLATDVVTSDGSKYINRLPEGELAVTGAFDVEFQDRNTYNVFIGNQQLDLTFVWVGDEIVAAGNRYRLALDLPNCIITTLPLPEIAGGSDRQMQTVDFVAIYDLTDQRVIRAQLVNGVVSYP